MFLKFCHIGRIINFQNPHRDFCYNITFEKRVTDYLLGTWEAAAEQRTAFLETLQNHPWQAGDHLHLELNLIEVDGFSCSGLRDLSPLHGLPFKEATIVGNENRGATPSLRLQGLGAFQLLQAVHIAGAQNVAHVLCDLPFVHTIDIGAFDNDFMEKMGAKNQLRALSFSSCDRRHNRYFPINLDILGLFTINLTRLNLSYCTYFEDCKILSPCKKLEVLDCSHCSRLKSTEGLEGCPDLVKVNLWVTNIYRTGGLANHPKLRELRLTNESKSLEFLQTCPNIEVLMLHKQGDLQKLPFLPKLRELELSQSFLIHSRHTQETPWPNLTQPLQLKKLAFGQAGFYVGGIRHHRASLTEEFGDKPLPSDCGEGETFESFLNKDTPDPGSDPDILARILSMCSKEHLEELHLPMCCVASDVSQLATYPNLKVLDLSRSNVKAIPASFAALKSLQPLDLDSCQKLEAVNVPGCVSLVHCNVRFCRKMSEAQKKALAPLL